MGRMKLISSILVVLTEAVAAFEDGKLTADEVFNTFEIAMRMFGVNTADPGFKFSIFMEQDGDLHLVLKAELMSKIMDSLTDVLS